MYFLAALVLLAAPVLSKSAAEVDGVFSLSVQKVSHDGLNADRHPISKRATGRATGKTSHAYMDQLANQRYYYLTQVEIGTPAQKLDLLLDTGSSDTWVMTSQTTSGRGNAVSGTKFDSTQSSSFKNNNTQWSIQYGKGQASGTWGTDLLSIGGARADLSIGLANSVSQISQGIVGIGRPQAEITFKQGMQYDNLPLALYHQGQIGAAAYSLVLDDLNSASGSILFGGVDHDLYQGPLVQLPITHPKHMGVQLQGIHADERATYQLLSAPQTAILDSGTSLTYVDQNTLTAVQTALNSNPSFALGERYYADCNITNNLWFDFGDTNIAVPAYNFMWPIELFVDGVTASLDFPQNSCYIGIEAASSDENFVLLGDNVLRAMYLVYDVSNNRIAIAKSKPSSGHPNVEAIVAGRPIPGVANANT